MFSMYLFVRSSQSLQDINLWAFFICSSSLVDETLTNRVDELECVS